MQSKIKQKQSRTQRKTRVLMASPNVIMAQPQTVTVRQHVTTVQMSTDWSSGTCDCCEDMAICCCGLWCLPCLECHTASEFGESCCLPLIVPGASLAMRTGVRERYRIQGSITNDCCMLSWCYPLVICQMAREIKRRKGATAVSTHNYTQVAQY
ncbi:cornifelin-like [Polyodon spathula]|uniref:cornifelin-like n=1 Tax=Polyodon spathula TaxID=7913 RepID=UPI001B7EF470|nr:cornifelin-like [Polyodon spathula]